MGRLTRLAPRLSGLKDRVARLPVHEARDQVQHWRAWYKTARWQRLRWQVLVRDLFTCAFCGVVEHGKGQMVADHRVPHRGDPALFWDADNLQCLCKSCHDSTKQRMERGGR